MLSASAQDNQFVINAKKPTAKIEKTMYGIFFEDINYAADGGLYAEMVKNRSFEFPQSLMGWSAFGKVEVRDDGPFERNPHYLRLGYAGHADKPSGVENEGFFGISTKEGESYRFSVWARCPEGNGSSLQVQLVDKTSMGEVQSFGECMIEINGSEWKKYEGRIQAGRTIDKGALRIFLRPSNGSKTITTTDIEHVSLFPVDTWKGRENGMRKDLAQALADLKPGIFRFPGGCIVEGTDLATRYQWKNTVGPVENRPLNENRWNYTFTHRFYPDYFQSYGLGFFEFFQLCEDFGCEALPVLSCGLSCQFQNTDPNANCHVAVDSLGEYIQDALDLIEFANGATDTKWGRVRADMGHPEPFGLHYIAIGNEQWNYKDNPAYTARLKAFLDVLRAKHPEVKYIGSTGPNSEGDMFDELQPKMKELKVDLYDEHFYRPESWFLDSINRHRYDNYDRRGPKVFAGEYACHGTGKKWNHYHASLLEAAFMTGFERNADVVKMATYAPLFAHIEGWQWRPDMIWYDNQRMFKSCSYYVQQLYGTYKGTDALSLTMNGKAVAGDADQRGLFASAAADTNDNSVIVKVANVSGVSQPLTMTFKGIKSFSSAKVISLSSLNPDAENTLDNPNLITPKEREIEVSGNVLNTEIPASSFAVYVLKK